MFRHYILTLLLVSSAASAQVVSPFAGSELPGEYRTDFTRLHYLLRDGDDIGQATAEGRLHSRIYQQPADATGSSSIEAESADTLDTIVQYLSENPERRFYVVGHTDDAGNLASNMALSEARAQAVVDALVEALPAAVNKLIARGVGPLSPVATNGADDGRALNRRVELVATHE